MLEGKIRSLDLEARTVEVETRDGRRLTASVPEHATVEVCEHETMGTMGGSLEDLEVGYLVELDVHDVHEGHPCECLRLVSVS